MLDTHVEELLRELVHASSALRRPCGDSTRKAHVRNRVELFTFYDADLDLQLLQCVQSERSMQMQIN